MLANALPLPVQNAFRQSFQTFERRKGSDDDLPETHKDNSSEALMGHTITFRLDEVSADQLFMENQMAKPQAPSESQLAPSDTAPMASQVVVLTDALGRQLTIKPLDILYESQLARIFGTEASNLPYMMGFVYPAASVCEIDGVPYARPTSQQEVDHAIQRLGREGFAAFLQHMQSEVEKIKQMAENHAEIKPG